MKKLYYFLPLLLVFGALQAEDESIIEPTFHSGRYQMNAVREGKSACVTLFLLDTKTGTVWKSSQGWGEYKEWKLIVPSLQQ